MATTWNLIISRYNVSVIFNLNMGMISLQSFRGWIWSSRWHQFGALWLECKFVTMDLCKQVGILFYCFKCGCFLLLFNLHACVQILSFSKYRITYLFGRGWHISWSYNLTCDWLSNQLVFKPNLHSLFVCMNFEILWMKHLGWLRYMWLNL
jgi:hypothetical protein